MQFSLLLFISLSDFLLVKILNHEIRKSDILQISFIHHLYLESFIVFSDRYFTVYQSALFWKISVVRSSFTVVIMNRVITLR